MKYPNNFRSLLALPSLKQTQYVRAFAVLAILLVCTSSGFTQVSTNYFSAASGSAWDASTTADWGTASGGPYNTLWVSNNAAVFEGTAGTVNVSASDIPTFSEMIFNVTGYTLSGGTLDLGSGTNVIQGTPVVQINEGGDFSFTINSVIAGTNNVDFFRSAGSSSSTTITTVDGLNTYTGLTVISACNVKINSIADGGTASSFGAGNNTVPVILANNGSAMSVTYTGPAASTDRPWTVNGYSVNNAFNNNGTGPVSFNNTGPVASTNYVYSSSNAREIQLGGTYTASANTFAEQVSDLPGAVTTLDVNHDTWNITASNINSGGVVIGTAGTLNICNPNALGTGPLSVTSSGLGNFDNFTGASLTVTNAFSLTNTVHYIGSVTNMTITGPVALANASGVKIYADGHTLTLSGQITGTELLKYGNYTLVLNNTGAPDSLTFGIDIAGGILDLGGTTQSLGPVVFYPGSSTTQNGTVNGTSYTSEAGNANVTVTVSANLAGSGATLTQSGGDLLVLSGQNTYSGATTISSGELDGVTGGSCANSAFTVSAETTNGVQVLTTGGQWVCGGLSYSDGAYLNIELGNTAPSSSTAPILVNGNLAFGNVNVIVQNSGAPIENGQYPLIKYTGSLSGTPTSVPFSITSLETGATASISNNVANQSIDLVVSGGTLYPPVINSFGVGGGGVVLTFSGTNGQTYTILTSTNLATPLANWTTVTSGAFSGTTVSYTNTSISGPQQFYIISSQ